MLWKIVKVGEGGQCCGGGDFLTYHIYRYFGHAEFSPLISSGEKRAIETNRSDDSHHMAALT